MSNNSNNFHFLGESLICNPYVIIIVPCFVRADNDKIRAAICNRVFRPQNEHCYIIVFVTDKKVYGSLCIFGSQVSCHLARILHSVQTDYFKWEVFEAGLTILNGKHKAFDYYVPGKRCSDRV